MLARLWCLHNTLHHNSCRKSLSLSPIGDSSLVQRCAFTSISTPSNRLPTLKGVLGNTTASSAAGQGSACEDPAAVTVKWVKVAATGTRVGRLALGSMQELDGCAEACADNDECVAFSEYEFGRGGERCAPHMGRSCAPSLCPACPGQPIPWMVFPLPTPSSIDYQRTSHLFRTPRLKPSLPSAVPYAHGRVYQRWACKDVAVQANIFVYSTAGMPSLTCVVLVWLHPWCVRWVLARQVGWTHGSRPAECCLQPHKPTAVAGQP